jgi:hypothetical protein
MVSVWQVMFKDRRHGASVKYKVVYGDLMTEDALRENIEFLHDGVDVQVKRVA